MESKPIVTIGIPTYNRPKGLEKVINDFINQTYDKLEIIISDNFSDDPDVQKIGEYYSKKYNYIHYIRQKENIGMYKNFEFVRDKANGYYFTWVSDDDEFHKDYITKCLDEYRRDPSLILVSPISVVTVNGQEIFKRKHNFDTQGLNVNQRIKKIANYVRKSHMALVGLYVTEKIRFIPVLPIWDSDGRILLEYSTFGHFKMLNNHLVSASIPRRYSNKQVKKKYISSVGIKNSFLLMYFETIYMSMYMSFMLLKKDNLSINSKVQGIFNVLKAYHNHKFIFKIFHSLHGYLSFLKKLKPILHISVNNENDIDQIFKHKVEIYRTYELVYITKNPNLKRAINLSETLSSFENVNLIESNFRNEEDEKQYVLDRAKYHHDNISHIELFHPKYFLNDRKKINSLWTINRALYINKRLIAYPVFSYVNFKSPMFLTIGKKVID